MACPPPVNAAGARAADWLSGGLRAAPALTPLYRLSPRSAPALRCRAASPLCGSLRAAPTRRARPLRGASWRASAPPDSLTAIGRLGNSPAGGVRWVPWLRPVPALVCAPSARLRNGRSARAPFGVPARAVGAPLRFAPAFSALRAPPAASSASLRPPALSGTLHVQKRVSARACASAIGRRGRALRALLARNAAALARAPPRLRAPSGRFERKVSLACARIVGRVVSGGCVERRFAPNRHPRPT